MVSSMDEFLEELHRDIPIPDERSSCIPAGATAFPIPEIAWGRP
jgi:hypothetical protein